MLLHFPDNGCPADEFPDAWKAIELEGRYSGIICFMPIKSILFVLENSIKEVEDMVHVIEYGKNIGTLKNLFRDEQEAMKFVQIIMDDSGEEYTLVEANKWYCARKNEYVKVEIL